MSERKTVTFGGEHGFGDVEFCNLHPRLLETAMFDILARLRDAVKPAVAAAPGLELLSVWGPLFVLRCADRKFFETARTSFPEFSTILEDGSVLPTYVGEFEKDGSAYVILIADKRIAESDVPDDWIPGTYRNMRFDPRS